MISMYITPECEIVPDNKKIINLTNTDMVYSVKKGTVHIFLSDASDSKKMAKARFPVTTAHVGDIFTGFCTTRKDGRCFAVGSLDTVVEAFSLNSVISLWRTQPSFIDSLFVKWFESVSSSVLRTSSRNRITVQCDDNANHTVMPLANGISAASKTLCWVKRNNESIAFPFLSELRCSKTGYFPLSYQLAVTAVEDTEIEIASSTTLCSLSLLKGNVYSYMQFIFDELFLNKTNSVKKASKLNENARRTEQKKYESALRNSQFMFLSQKKQKEKGMESDAKIESSIISAVIRTCRNCHIIIQPLEGKKYDDTVSTIYEVARDSNIRVRDVTLNSGWHHSDVGNLVAFYSTEQDDVVPVSLFSRNGSSYTMVTSDGVSVLVDDTIATNIAKTAYMFYRPLPDEQITIKKIVRFAMTGLSSVVVRFGILGLICACVGMLIPEITRVFTDTIIPEAAVNRMVQLSILVVVTAVSSGFFEFVKGLALTRLETKSDWTLQAAVMDRVMKMPISFFKNYTSGDLTERTLAISSIRQVLSGTVISSLMSFLFSIVYLFQLFSYSSSLAIKAILFSLIPAFVSAAINIKRYSKDKKIASLQGTISGQLLEFIRGSSKIVTTSSEKRVFCEWVGNVNQKNAISFMSGKILNAQTVFSSCFSLIVTMCFYGFFISGMKSGNNGLSTGAFLAFMAAFSSFQGSLSSVISALSQSIMVIPLYERAKPILDERPEILKSKPSILKLNGSIEVNNVNFRYSSDGPLILKNVSVKVEPGEFVALVGGSGSGKSTLLRLLLGFEKAESGSIYFDNQDIDSIDISSVRRRMGVVLQNGSLMQGSIFNNIAGSSSLTLDDAWKAAALSGLSEDVKQMPMGMHTMISMGGGGLSGGQRQRLIIARAIAHHPDVLFFDEATSALDNKTQKTVSESLERMNVTRIVIAHRLSTIIKADRIYVLQNGEIIETGNYESLMKAKGFFFDLASRQKV